MGPDLLSVVKWLHGFNQSQNFRIILFVKDYNALQNTYFAL